jgi:carbon starvation protein
LTLPKKVGAFVEGSANMIAALGVPHELAIGVIATMVACFAATTLDTATRLQRYVIQELGGVLKRPALTNKYTATALAVVTGGALALYPGPHGPGSGGLILWPLFGAINQLLAGLAFLVLAFYLLRHSKPVWFVLGPLALMVVMPAWAMISNIVKWTATGQWLLVCFGVGIELLQAWMVYEGVVMWRKARGTPPAPLPPRPASVRAVRDKAAG